MIDPLAPSGKSRGKAMFAFLSGCILGAILGAIFSSGMFSTAVDPISSSPPDENAVTFSGADGTASRSSDEMMARLLDGADGYGFEHARKVLAFVDSVSPEEIEAKIDEILAIRNGNQGSYLIRSLYEKWAEQDPQSAFRHAQSLKGGTRTNALNAVLFTWASNDPHAVVAWAGMNRSHESTQDAINAAVCEIARSHPEEALALAAKFTGIDTSSVFSIWAGKDPVAASIRAESIQNSYERRLALRSTAAQWARSDPRAAWDWANSQDRKTDRIGALEMIFSHVVADGEMEHAIAFLEVMPHGEIRREALQQVAWSLGLQDPERAFELVKSQTLNEETDQAYSSVFQRWAERDPHRAFEIAKTELGAGSARSTAIEHALKGIASREPARALELLGELDEATKDKVSASIARVLATTDHHLALQWAESLTNSEVKEQSMSIILDEWARVDPLPAVAYGLTIGNQSLRRLSLGRALDQWGRDDAVSAMTWAVTNLPPGDQEDLVPRLLGKWVQEDVEESAKWVAALPEGELRDASVSSLVGSWASRDLVAAGEWLKQIPDGKGRDAGASQYASHVYDTDPEAALVWAESIDHEATRIGQVEMLAKRYLKHEPEKAKRWIANSSLPPERKEAMLKAADQK